MPLTEEQKAENIARLVAHRKDPLEASAAATEARRLRKAVANRGKVVAKVVIPEAERITAELLKAGLGEEPFEAIPEKERVIILKMLYKDVLAGSPAYRPPVPSSPAPSEETPEAEPDEEEAGISFD